MKPEDPKKAEGVENGQDALSEALEAESGAGEATKQAASGVGVFFLMLVISAVLLTGAGWLLGKTSARSERMALVAEKDATISEQNATIIELNDAIERKEAEMAEQEAEIRKITRRELEVDENGVIMTRMIEFYGSHDPYCEPEIQNDEEFRAWCQENWPEAIYPYDEWTAEDVIVAWVEKPEIWGSYTEDYYDDTHFFTWSADWEHCFILDAYMTYDLFADDAEWWSEGVKAEHKAPTTGWLVVDGLRVQMLDQETYDIYDPYELVRQYQAGEWDGSNRRSPDGSTRVRVSSYDGGLLDYWYQAYTYDESADPLGIAWTDFDRQPWWTRADVPEELISAIPERRREWTDPWGEAPNMMMLSSADVEVYVDLPIGYDASEFVEIVKTSQGTFCYSAEGVKLFRKGELIEEWAWASNTRESLMLMRFEEPSEEYAQDLAYLYCGGQILALRAGGELEVVLENLQYVHYNDAVFLGFHEDKLIYWKSSVHYEGTTSPAVVATDVLEVDVADVPMLRKEDGWYAIVRGTDGGFTLLYLGETEGLEYYSQLYKDLSSARYLFR